MDICKYTSHFHDGGIRDILVDGKNIIFTLESSQVNPDRVKNIEVLSNFGNFVGRLHLGQVQNVDFVEGMECDLKMHSDSGTILDFMIDGSTIELNVEWDCYGRFTPPTRYTIFKIEAENIFWENLPSLTDPRYPPIECYTNHFSGGFLKEIKIVDSDELQVVVESAVIDTESMLWGCYKPTERGTLMGTLQMLWVQRLLCNGKEVTVDSLSTRDASGVITKMSISNHWVTLDVLRKSLKNEKNQEVIEERIEILAGAISWRDRLE